MLATEIYKCILWNLFFSFYGVFLRIAIAISLLPCWRYWIAIFINLDLFIISWN